MADLFEDSIAQLKAIVSDSERCANQIFDACEKLGKELAGVDTATVEKINEQVARIIEACHFQDFSGQRSAKIINHMNYAKDTVGPIEQKALSKDEQLMQGPQTEAASQDDIDKLFENG